MLLQESTTPVRDAGDAVTGAFAIMLAAIPRALGFAVILIVGWLLASLLAKGVAALLHAVKFNELAQRAGLSGFVRNMGVKTDASGVIAGIAKWFVRLIALVVAFDALGLPAVSQVLQEFLLWIPNLVVAMVVLVIGGLAARALGGLVRGAAAEAGFTNPDLLATVARVAVIAFSVIVAVNQLGIATALINTLLIGVVGALALASGLAFGLGGRDRAARLLDSWSARAETPGPRLERASDAAGQRTRETSLWTGMKNPSGWADRSAYDRRQRYPTPAEMAAHIDWVERSPIDRREAGAR